MFKCIVSLDPPNSPARREGRVICELQVRKQGQRLTKVA